MADRPDPAGPMPDGWDPLKWLAYQALLDGASYRKAGELVGRQTGTISGWVSRWRLEYGREVIPSRPSKLTPEAGASGRLSASIRTATSWAAVRAVAARKTGELSATALDLAQQVLDGYLADPVRRRELTIDDALKLAKLADLLAARADTLGDIGAAPGPGVPLDSPGIPPGLLDGLESDPGGDDAEVIEMLELVAGRYRTIAESYDAAG